MKSTHQKSCPVCHQGQAQSLFPIVMTRKNNDTLYTQQHNICKQCQKQLLRIKAHSEGYMLKFGKGSPKTREMISLYMDLNQIVSDYQTEVPNKNAINQSVNTNYNGYDPQEQPFYNDSIYKIINNNKLYQSQCLPNNLKYLLFCSSYNILSSERHERVRNIMLRVMVGHAFPISTIKNVSILTQVLLCYFLDFEVYIIMGRLAQVLSDRNEQSEGWGKIIKGVKGDKVFDQIANILKQGLDSNGSKNSSSVNDQFKTSQFKQRSQLKNRKQEINQLYPKSNRRQSINQNLIEKCYYNSNLQMFKEISRMKNHCTLIMSSFLQEQQKFKQIMKQIQNKHKKQKEQYIKKIVLLNEKISQLEGKKSILITEQQQIYNINNLQQNKQISIKQILALTTNKDNKSTVETKSNKRKSINTEKKNQKLQVSNTKTQKQQVYLNNNNQQQEEIHIYQNNKNLKKQYNKQQIQNQKYSIFQDNILKIIQQTNIIPIPSSVQNIISPKVVDNIILKINKLQQQNKVLNLKIKQQQSEVRRLLLILKKKQQKFIPLMHEKDQIIQMYENALWKLENGLPMGENKLAPRIQMIRKLELELVKNQEKISKSIKKKKESIKDKTNEGKISKKVQNLSKNQAEKQSCIIF